MAVTAFKPYFHYFSLHFQLSFVTSKSLSESNFRTLPLVSLMTALLQHTQPVFIHQKRCCCCFFKTILHVFFWNRDVVAVFSYSDFRVYARKQDAEQWLEIGEKVYKN